MNSVDLDRAFYFEGSWIHLSWQSEHTWLIRVSHPGGYYHGDDSTWSTAKPAMKELRITFYGVFSRKRLRIPVRVVPRQVPDRARAIAQAQLATYSIYQGPTLSPHARTILSQRLPLAPYTSEIDDLLAQLRTAPDIASSQQIADQYLQQP